MKKILAISLILILILFTAYIKNSTKRTDEVIFLKKENLRILKKDYENLKLEHEFLSSAEKLFQFHNLYFEEKLKKKKIDDIIKYIKKNRPKTKVIVAITKQGWLNKLGAYILNEPDAHTNFNLSPIDEINILSKHMKIIKKKNIFFLTDIYMFEF